MKVSELLNLLEPFRDLDAVFYSFEWSDDLHTLSYFPRDFDGIEPDGPAVKILISR